MALHERGTLMHALTAGPPLNNSRFSEGGFGNNFAIFIYIFSPPKNVSWSTDFSKTNASRSQDSDYVRLEFTFDRPESERECLV